MRTSFTIRWGRDIRFRLHPRNYVIPSALGLIYFHAWLHCLISYDMISCLIGVISCRATFTCLNAIFAQHYYFINLVSFIYDLII